MDSPETQSKYAHNGKVMLVTSTLLFLIILLLIFLYVYCPSCFCRRRRRHHRPLIQTDSTTAAFNKSLHPSVLNILPTFTYSSDTHRHLQDCVVCLLEFTDGDKCRVLRSCNHAFHSHCVDPWFRSHSNCPLCRTPVYPRVAKVQPESTTSVGVEPSLVGFSSLPALIGCPRKSMDLELVSVIVEVEDWSLEAERFGFGESVIEEISVDLVATADTEDLFHPLKSKY